MTTSGTASHLSEPPTWVRVLLGIVLIVAGIFILGDIAIATLISTIFVAVVAVIAGVFEIAHAFWTKAWGSFAWQILLGVLYVAFGIVLLNEPASGSFESSSASTTGGKPVGSCSCLACSEFWPAS